MLNFLYQDKYAPITSEIGFLECDAKIAADAFLEWSTLCQNSRELRLLCKKINGDLPQTLEHLLPLTSVEARRYLFVPTDSQWTAYFDNGWRGTDAFSTVSHLCTQIKCKGIRGVAIPHTLRKSSGRETGRSGGIIFELYYPDSNMCTFLNVRRSISLVHDGKWDFSTNGNPPLEFEQLAKYKQRQIYQRFTLDMLNEYMNSLGINFFDPQFYRPQDDAYLVYKEGASASGLKTYSLEEARSGY